MVKIIHLADDGSETAAVVLEDFTVEVIYSGIADMLREASAAERIDLARASSISREGRLRRDKILARIRS
jgi:hypothetical protein